MKCILKTERGVRTFDSVSLAESVLEREVPVESRTPNTKFVLESPISTEKWIITFGPRGTLLRKRCKK